MKMKLSIIGSGFRKTLFLISSACLLAVATIQAQQLAFPGAMGYGAYATGGRSGTVYHVTNLNDSGSGSFRDAVSASGRTVVFDVGGVINITSALVFSDNITVAGQTAPGGGIVVYGNSISLSSHHNIIIRYITFRQGINSSSGSKALNMTTSYNIILDHVSVAWGRWDTFGITGTSHDITIQNCILAEGIDPQNFGGLIDGEDRITLARNLFINNQSRNPKGKANLQYINNVIYNWGSNGYCGGHSAATWLQDLINNYFIAGPSSSIGNILTQFTATDTIYNSGNYADLDKIDATGNGVPGGRLIVESDFIPNTAGQPSATFVYSPQNTPPVAVPIMSAADAYVYVVNNAGNSLHRDGVDQRLISDVRSLGTLGAIIANEAVVGGQSPIAGGIAPVDTDQDGMPDYWELAMGLNPNDASDRNNLGSDGYTSLEEDLNWLSGPHVLVQSNTTVNVDLNQYTAGFTNPVYSVSDPTKGAVTLLGDDHTAQFTPTTNYIGMASFSYSLIDQNGSTVTDTVSVLVSPLPPPPPPPAAPGGLTATTAGTTGINLGWVNNATNATSVLLERSTDNLTFSQIASLDAAVTNYSDTGLVPATTYYYRVRAANSGGYSGYSDTAHATTVSIPAVTWVGDGVLNVWDVGITTNWFNGTSATVFSNASAVTFDDTGSASPAVNMVGSLQALLVVVTNSSQNYTVSGSGSMTGSMALTKSGSGQLTLGTNNAYTGGTTLNAGTLTLGAVSGAGSGTITMNGGTLSFGNGSMIVGNPLKVLGTSTLVPNSGSLNGSITGSGTLNVLPSSQFTLNGSMSSFSGTIELGTGSVLLRFIGSAGSSNAIFDLGTSTASMKSRNGNVTVYVGALLGGPRTILGGATVGMSDTHPTTWVIGGLNLNTVFSGSITEDAARATSYKTAITKVGSGTLTLTGTNSFGGGVQVKGGTLLLDGTQTLLSNSTFTVTNALLGGNGTIFGLVTVNPGGGITPGDGMGAPGTLTMSNLTLNTPTMYFDLSSSTNGPNDKITLMGGLLTMSGTQTYNFNLMEGVLNAGTYTLIGGGTNTSASSVVFTHNLPGDTRQTFALQGPPAGNGECYIRLVVTGNPATLTWQGINGNVWDLNNTTNWNNGGVTDNFFNSDVVIFDDTASNGNVDVTGTVQPRSILITNSATAYTITSTNGSIGGTTTLIKLGAGVLALNGGNTFSGGTTLNDGILVLNNASAAGSGTITLNGGTLTLGASIGNALNVAGTSALNPGTNTLSGTISGNGTLNINIPGSNTFTVTGDMTGFLGTFALGASTGFFQMNPSGATYGSSNAVFDLGFGSATLNNLNGDVTINLGALTGGTNTSLSGSSDAAHLDPTTYVIGGNNTSTNFDGAIADGFGPTAVTKVGSGTWTLTGTNNTYTGGTTVNNGTLLVNNASGSGLGSGPVNVSSGATLGGSGLIEAPVSLDNGGILAPGASSVGTLTLGGDFLFLSSGSVLQYALGTSSDLTVVTGDLALAGVLNISDAGGFGPGTYTLFTYGGSMFTNGTAGVLTIGTVPSTNLTYTVDISSNGYVNLIVSVPPTAFQQWQMQYFGCTNCAEAAPTADPDGDGLNNQAEFLAGTNPTNSLSGLRIISVVRQSTNVVITWTTAGVRTNAVQATDGDANGGYTNNFNDISGSIIIPVSGDTTANYTEVGGATHTPSRYYRIRLVP